MPQDSYGVEIELIQHLKHSPPLLVVPYQTLDTEDFPDKYQVRCDVVLSFGIPHGLRVTRKCGDALNSMVAILTNDTVSSRPHHSES